MRDWKAFNGEVVAPFRANGGSVAGLGETPVFILHTIGARSGVIREAAGEQFVADVVQSPDDDADRIVGARAANVPQLAEYVVKAAPRRIPVFSIKRA